MRAVLILALLLVSACAGHNPLADEVMIGDRPLAWKVSDTTPNVTGRKCSKDDIVTYSGRYLFERQAAAVRYLDKYKHCQA